MMPKRISADIDIAILTDIGLGLPYKDIAVKHNVSASYVSKVANGKKVPDIHVPEPSKTLDDDIETFTDDIEAVSELLGRRKVVADKKSVEEYLKTQLYRTIVRAKIYVELLKKYKGD
jgi:DUF1365 family protein